MDITLNAKQIIWLVVAVILAEYLAFKVFRFAAVIGLNIWEAVM